MSNLPSQVSACRHCLHYQVEGRRGGSCQQLGVPVQSQWRACPLATPFFAAASAVTAELALAEYAGHSKVTPLPTPINPVSPMIVAIAPTATPDYAPADYAGNKVIPIGTSMRPALLPSTASPSIAQ